MQLKSILAMRMYTTMNATPTIQFKQYSRRPGVAFTYILHGRQACADCRSKGRRHIMGCGASLPAPDRHVKDAVVHLSGGGLGGCIPGQPPRRPEHASCSGCLGHGFCAAADRA